MPINEKQPQGYILVAPDLVYTEVKADKDVAVQCLSYLISVIASEEFAPYGAKFEIIKAQYIGGPWPAIGMYTETYVDTDEALTDLSLALEDKLSAHLRDLSMPRLLHLCEKQGLTWDDVLSGKRVPFLKA